MIRLMRPDVRFDEVADDIRTILDSGILTRGSYLERFESAVASHVGVRHAFATTSCTTALHLSLVAAGIGSGDEVLVSDFTFPASGNAIVQAGARPVMVDCLPGRFDLDPDDAAAKVNSRTRAIMPIDPFGQPAELTPLHVLADRHGLLVVEDAACALGAQRDGRHCGAWSGASCFSFHPRKVPTTGEGGMITTDDNRLAERIELLRNHGGTYGEVGAVFTAHGFNYRMSEIQAALGLAQMKNLDEIIEDRRRTAAAYMDLLHEFNCITVPLSAPPAQCTFQSFVVMLADEIDRGQVIRRLREVGIETTLGTYAMHAHPAFAHFGYKPGDLPNAWRAERQSLTLPLLPKMKPDIVNRVVDGLRGAIEGAVL